MSDDNFLDDAVKSFVGDDDDDNSSDDSFYSDDVQAAALADNNMDPDEMEEHEEEIPVTSGDMEIGDLDNDPELSQGSEESADEESTPAGDNVLG